jgi:predicted RNA-binding protein Jag
MGIQELWKVIGHSGKEFTLEQLASNQFNKNQGKGLRVAIDTALWIFQAKSSVVGE